MKDLFKNHIEKRLQQTAEILNRHNLDNLYIDNSFPHYYYLDDQPTFFKPNPHFNFYCPDPGQGHILKINKNGDKPTLYYYVPADFWHEVSSLQGKFWEDFFDIKVISGSPQENWQKASAPGKNVVISPFTEVAVEQGLEPAPSIIFHELNWLRSSKSEYEIECIRSANKKAAKGHKKAHELFLEGASELDIYMGYLMASDQRESELPYNSITALDSNTAVLHYQFPKTTGEGKTFLIDAGARFHGYCSDITRTYIKNGVDETFASIIKKVEDHQKELVELVTPGKEYVEIHSKSYDMVYDILVEFGIYKGSKEEAYAKRVPYYFYPHGVGHPLGIQVHDVAGKVDGPRGDSVTQPKDFPNLRTLRTVQEKDVLTIEPGFYFIPMLYNELKKNRSVAGLLDWNLIEKLTPLGGVRIEDDIVARSHGPENLTRPFLP